MGDPAREAPLPSLAGLRHVALNVEDLARCERFYTETLGLRVAWRPDSDNVYLTSGDDSLALHRASGGPRPGPGRVDHIGFVVADPREVDRWHVRLTALGVPLRAAPRTHRDGARSFYCEDPEGNVVQILALATPPTPREPGAPGSSA